MTSITKPNGERIDIVYQAAASGTWDVVRISQVTSNYGYSLSLTYARPSAPTTTTEVTDWLNLTAVNSANLVTSPAGTVWPSATFSGASWTNQAGEQTQVLGDSTTSLTIRWPATPTANNVVVDYTSGKVRAVTVGGDVWRYAYTDGSGFTVTATVTAPDATTTVSSFNGSGQVVEFTDSASRKFRYTYGAEGRVDQVTGPYAAGSAPPATPRTDYAFDARGNITSATQYSATTSDTIVTSATYATDCTATNRTYCNSPMTTTDPRGKVTDYTYAPHGGVATIKLPAPETGPLSTVRPQSRITYAAQTAYSGSITLPVASSQCATATVADPAACVGTAAETRSLLTYGASPIWRSPASPRDRAIRPARARSRRPRP